MQDRKILKDVLNNCCIWDLDEIFRKILFWDKEVAIDSQRPREEANFTKISPNSKCMNCSGAP